MNTTDSSNFYDATAMQARRIAVMAETLRVLRDPVRRDEFHARAARNFARWVSHADREEETLRVEVFAEDWGVLAGRLTRESGMCYAVLNMANAYLAGGGYLEGYSAQEENMFRRTDCHFSLTDEQIDRRTGKYLPHLSQLINGLDGRVYLDKVSPRVGVRGPEQMLRNDCGYAWLSDEEIFPFYELRAAALNCARGEPFCPIEARRRIDAQLDTLMANGIRHAVLGASGCGAFANPASEVALAYREAILRRRSAFSHLAFAVFNSSDGFDNYTPFATALHGLGCG